MPLKLYPSASKMRDQMSSWQPISSLFNLQALRTVDSELPYRRFLEYKIAFIGNPFRENTLDGNNIYSSKKE